MKILIAPGAFKHSLSASQVAQAIYDGFDQSGLSATYHLLPIADGGNGTLDAFLANGGERIIIEVFDPLMRPIQAAYGLIDNGKTAIIEMAMASGIELLSNDEANPIIASTYGTGQLMQHALDKGATHFIVGLGGSATVDGGMGCLQALGLKLLDVNGEEISHGGSGLADIATVDTSNIDKRWHDIEIVIASDVENPTLGEKGAARVFGPQKGATPEMVESLETNLTHCFTTIYEQTGRDVRELEGGGAAGAFSAGLMAFLSCKIVSGIDLVLEHNGFIEHLADTTLIITGEGEMDSQTIDGKGPIGVARLAKKHGVPTIALVGGLNVDDTILHEAGIQAVFSVIDKPMELQTALSNAEELVRRAALRLGYTLQVNW
jgi:glycerate 2-kinase